MAEADNILQGVLIGSFLFIGIASFSYCIRIRMKNNSSFKQSPSMEDLNSVDTTDPEHSEV